MITQKKNKFKLLKEKKGMWRVFSTGLKEIMVKIWHFLQKINESTLWERKKKTVQYAMACSHFFLPFHIFFFLYFFVFVYFFKIIVWDEKNTTLCWRLLYSVGFLQSMTIYDLFFHCKLLRFTSSFIAFFVFVQIFRLRLLLFGRCLRHLQASFEMCLCAFRLTKR